jgi:hypothetical protein
MVLEIQLELLPISMVIANFLAPGTDRDEASQCTDLCQSGLQLTNEPLSFAFGVPPFGSVPKQHRDPLAERVYMKAPKPINCAKIVIKKRGGSAATAGANGGRAEEKTIAHA